MNRSFVQLIFVQLIVAFVAAVLTGCAGADAAPVAAEAPAVATAPAAEPAPDTDPAPVAGCTGEPIPGGSPVEVPPVEVTARLVEGRVEPPPSRVDVSLGAPVVLRVEAGAPAEVHVHGYDAAADAAPGAPACLQFVADVPGVFEVESHPDHTLLLQLAVR